MIQQVCKLWDDITLPMLKIFGADITPAHWLYAGYLYGKRDTGKMSLTNHLN
jgi:hypothetical protein